MAARNKFMRRKTRLLSICAMLSALGVVLLYLGSFVEVLDLSVAVLASFAVILVVIEEGGFYPWAVFGATSILALILLPAKTPAIAYACFLGFYPILKEKIERIRMRTPVRLLKLAVFNVSLIVMWYAANWLVGEMDLATSIVVVFLLLNAIFLFYDYALSVLITAYYRVWRRRLRIDRLFYP